MEKRGLSQYINIGLLKNDFSVDLYFVFKTSNGEFKKYSIKPDSTLSSEVITSYLLEIEKYVKSTSPFKISSVYDGNITDTWILYEDETSKNRIARELFLTSEESNPKIAYTRDHGSYSQIFGILVVLSTENGNEIKMFTKQNPFQAVQKQKYFNVSLDDDTFKSVGADTIYFQRSFDILCVDDKLIIKNMGVYEKHFGFKEILAQRAFESFKALSKNYKFWFPDNKEAMFKKLSTKSQKKLIGSLNSENPVLKNGNYDAIKKQLKRLSNRETEMSVDGNVKIQTATQFRNLIRILNMDFGWNGAAKKYILAESRTILKGKKKALKKVVAKKK